MGEDSRVDGGDISGQGGDISNSHPDIVSGNSKIDTQCIELIITKLQS